LAAPVYLVLPPPGFPKGRPAPDRQPWDQRDAPHFLGPGARLSPRVGLDRGVV